MKTLTTFTVILLLAIASPARAAERQIGQTGDELLKHCTIMHQVREGHRSGPVDKAVMDGYVNCYGYLRGYMATMR